MVNGMHEINILFVDDEKFTLHALDRLLRKEKFNKFFAENGAEALEVLTENSIHIVVSDMKMPEMDGLTLLRKIKEQYPGIIRLVLSAYTHTAQLLPCINSGEVFRFITKPLDKDELKDALSDAINLFSIQNDNQELTRALKDCNEKLNDAKKNQKILEQWLLTLDMVDETTGFLKKEAVFSILGREMNKCESGDYNLSLIMISLDQFTQVEDTYGYDFSCLVLKEFASRMKKNLRLTDMVFRYGSEEFLLVQPQTDLEEAKAVSLQITDEAVNRSYEHDNIKHHQTVTTGVASFEVGLAETSEEFIARANKNVHRSC
jgi:diguanylate cyclase (GGDEF)-like protein